MNYTHTHTHTHTYTHAHTYTHTLECSTSSTVGPKEVRVLALSVRCMVGRHLVYTEKARDCSWLLRPVFCPKISLLSTSWEGRGMEERERREGRE